MAIEGVQPYIIFTSPEGNVFQARWSGNEESKDKAVGRFHSPGTVGERVQDQGTKSPTIPLSFFFSGEDYITISKAYFDAWDEFGNWEINHPEDGIRILQPLTISQDKQPVTSGNVRSFTTSWMEPNLEEDEQSIAELKAGIEADVLSLNAAAAQELEDNISQTQQSEITAFAESTTAVVSDTKNGTSSIFEDNALSGVADVAIGSFNAALEATRTAKAKIQSVQDDFNRIEKSILDTVDQVAEIALSPLTIALQLQELAQTPSRAIDNIQNRINAYKETNELMKNKLLGVEPTVAGKNSMQTTQVGLTGALSASCLSVTTGIMETRAQALNAADDIAKMWSGAVGSLDDAASLFLNSNIENQFFSQTETYNRLSQIIAKAIKILISLSFSLKVEKRFILEKDKSPHQVCVEEYGLIGENDEILTYFYVTNDLYEKENLLLKAGFEVVVYK